MSDDWPIRHGPVSAPKDVTHYVSGFDAFGRLLVQTWHRGVGSMQIEVEAWKSRMRKHEVARIEIMHVGETPVRTEVIRPQDIDMPPPTKGGYRPRGSRAPGYKRPDKAEGS